MKTQHPTILAARVAAVNRANAEVNRLAPLYREAIKPFLGKVVIKADGLYTAKVKAVFPLATVDFPSYFVYSLYLGCFTVKTFESYGNYSCVYAEPAFYAFTVNREGIAEPLAHEFVPLRTDYTVAEIEAARVRVEELEELARQAKAACEPFGLFDR